MKDIQAVIFDMYGTLVHNPNETHPYICLFDELKLQLPDLTLSSFRDIVLKQVHKNLASVVIAASPSVQTDTSNYQRMVEAEVDGVRIYEDSINTLKALNEKGKKLGLISNLATPYKTPLFTLGLSSYFSKPVFSDEVGLVKPEEEIYQIEIDRLGLAPEQILFVGDSKKNDYNAPLKLGMHALHLNRKRKEGDSIASLRDVLQYVA